MKENFLHFMSDIPCTLNINGQYIGNIDNDANLELDIITQTDKIFVSYTPISNENPTLPYTTLIETTSIPTTTNRYIDIIPFPDNNYDVIMHSFCFNPEVDTKILFNKSVGKFFVSISCEHKTRIIIYSGVTITFSTNIEKVKAVKVEEQNNFIIIRGVIDDESYCLLVIDINNFTVIYNEIVNSIENNNNELITYKRLNSLCNHGLVTKLNLNNQHLEKYYVFENENVNIKLNNYFIPLAFLECVQIGDIESAKYFLSSNYQNATLEQFQDYFGKIDKIYFNRHNSFESKPNYTIKTKTWRNFNFLMDNNKIDDIEEVF